MKYTLKKLSETRVSVDISLDVDMLQTAKKHAVKELGKSVKVQGFRKGKVPANIIEKNIDPNSLGAETVQNAINLALNEVIEKEQLRVLDQPNVDLKKFVPYDTLELTAEIDILGPVTLGNYKKLKSKKDTVSVSDAEVDEVIERMQRGMAERKDVTRAVKDGDEVTMDFAGSDQKGQAIEGASGQDYTLAVGSKTFIPGFEEQLIGHSVGEPFDITVTFPKDYHADHLKNAKVSFRITLKKVQEVTLPKVDDAFAKQAGPFDSAGALREDIRTELTAQKDRQATEKLKDDLLGELVESSKVPVPDVLIDDQQRIIEQDVMQNLMYRGQNLQQYVQSRGFTTEEEWRSKELREAAERRVKAGLVIAELSKKEDIDVSTDELEAELARRKTEAPNVASQLDTPEVRRDLANRVMTEKTIDRLIALNT